MENNQTKNKIIETSPPYLKKWNTPEIEEISVLNTKNGGLDGSDGDEAPSSNS